jgi:hypothetical protein
MANINTFINFLCGPNGELSSKRGTAIIAVIQAIIVSYVYPENIPLVTAWLTFAGALWGIAAFSKT